MRLADARQGDRVVITGTVNLTASSKCSIVLFDGAQDRNYVDLTAEVEIIERPWKVGDRFSRYDMRWVISATQDGYYWAWNEEENEPCSFNEHDMKEAKRLQD